MVARAVHPGFLSSFSPPLPVLSLSTFLSPPDANAGLAKKDSGLTPVLWANITPQQVWRHRGSGREARDLGGQLSCIGAAGP